MALSVKRMVMIRSSYQPSSLLPAAAAAAASAATAAPPLPFPLRPVHPQSLSVQASRDFPADVVSSIELAHAL